MPFDHGLAWLAMAACRREDTKLFFPGSSDTDPVAVAICNRCRVRPDCLTYALARPELSGIWGGTSDGERRLLRRATG